jgi:hypothetical protein
MALEWKQAIENRRRVSTSSANSAMKRLKPRPYTVTAVQQLFPLDWKARSRCSRWFQESRVKDFLIQNLRSSSMRHSLHGTGV